MNFMVGDYSIISTMMCHEIFVLDWTILMAIFMSVPIQLSTQQLSFNTNMEKKI